MASKKFNQMVADIVRYKELQKKLNPDNAPFVVMEATDDWREFNRLTIKLTPVIVSGGLELTQTKLW